MSDEEKKQINETGAVDDMTQDYLDTIKNLKENSVDRAKYDALKAEHKKVLEMYVDGRPIESQKEPEYRDVNVIRNELFNKEHNNLDYFKLVLELRNTLIAKGERDPFLPYGTHISPTAEDVEKAEKAAKIYQECIDYADGDSEIFTQELQRRTTTSVYDRVSNKKK